MIKFIQKGFTLTEIMIVIAIIGILANVLSPQIANYRERARNSAFVSDIRVVSIAANADFSDFDNWAPDINPSNCLYHTGGWQGIYIPRFVSTGKYSLEKWKTAPLDYKLTYCFDWQNWDSQGSPGWASLDVYEVDQSGSMLGVPKRQCLGTNSGCVSWGMR